MRLISIVLLVVALTISVQAQGPTSNPGPIKQPQLQTEKVTPKTPYDSTVGQVHGNKMLRLTSDARDFAQQAQLQLQQLKSKQAAEKKLFDDWAAEVCKDNGWDQSQYKYDIDTDTWYHVVPPPAPVQSTVGDKQGNVVVDAKGKTLVPASKK